MHAMGTEFWTQVAEIEDAIEIMRRRLASRTMLGVSLFTPPSEKPHAAISGVEEISRVLGGQLPRRVQMTPVGSEGFIRSIETGPRGYAVVTGSEGLSLVAGANRITCVIRDELMRGERAVFLIRPPNQTGAVQSWALRPGGVWRPMGDGLLAEVRVGVGTPPILWGRTQDGTLMFLPREYAAPGMVSFCYWEEVRGAPEDLVAIPHRIADPLRAPFCTARGIVYTDLTRIHEGLVRVVGEERALRIRVVGDIAPKVALIEEWREDGGAPPIQKIVSVDRSGQTPRYTAHLRESHERPLRAATSPGSDELAAS